MSDALKSFYLCKKKVNARKGIFFLFYRIVKDTLFLWKNMSENLYEPQFHRFCDNNIVDLAFKFVLNKDQSGWLTASHSVQLHLIFLLFTSLDYTGWDFSFIVTLEPLESKASYTLMFHDAISLKVVVGTYMGGATSVYNEKNILGVPLGLSFHRKPPWLGLWKVGNM